VALAFRRQMNSALTAAHHDLQGTAKEDVDTLLRSVKHLETRLLDRIEDLETRLEAIQSEIARPPVSGPRGKPKEESRETKPKEESQEKRPGGQ
jgi:cell division septum initiation protein DivIVA